MALIKLVNSIKAIADAIREKTGDTAPMTLDEMAESIEYLEGDGGPIQTFILIDEDGHEMQAFLTEEEVVLDATPNDIRIGTTAVTDAGVTVGEKEIPSYYVTEGARKITAGSQFLLKVRDGRYAYTKLQALFCIYNTSITNSVSTDKVAVNDNVYPVNSTNVISAITLDDDAETILFNIKNDSDNAYVLRYFSYKEEY